MPPKIAKFYGQDGFSKSRNLRVQNFTAEEALFDVLNLKDITIENRFVLGNFEGPQLASKEYLEWPHGSVIFRPETGTVEPHVTVLVKSNYENDMSPIGYTGANIWKTLQFSNNPDSPEDNWKINSSGQLCLNLKTGAAHGYKGSLATGAFIGLGHSGPEASLDIRTYSINQDKASNIFMDCNNYPSTTGNGLVWKPLGKNVSIAGEPTYTKTSAKNAFIRDNISTGSSKGFYKGV